MTQDLKQAYFLKNTANGTFTDVTTLFQGVRILKVDGMGGRGKPKNVYTQDWMYDDAEDMEIVMNNDTDAIQILRENVDIEVTFIVKQKYASQTIDVLTQHDLFVGYMTNTDVWIKSNYMGDKSVHCVCLSEYKPTIMKLKRGSGSFAMGTITLHCLEPAS